MPVSRNRKKKRKKKPRVKAGSAYEKFVASTIQAMDSTIKVHPHHWEDGPDGYRDMDVLIEGILNGSPHKILIECKDFDRKKTGPVGIHFVDALDSKRHDLDVDSAIICSNSGFTKDAIRKAKRKKIGLVSIVKAGDPHVKNVIQEEVYIRKIEVDKVNISIKSEGEGKQPDISIELIEYPGLPLINWIWNKMAAIICLNPTGLSAKFSLIYNFQRPIEFQFNNQFFPIHSIKIQFSVNTEWFSQIVTIDADLGIYDYLRGRIRFSPSSRNYNFKGLNIVDQSIVAGGKPINFIPEKEHLQPYEIAVALMEVKGIKEIEPSLVPNIDDLIVPEDLNLDLSYNEELSVYTNLPN